MRVDERGRVFFDKGDRVRPKRITTTIETEDPKTGKMVRRVGMGNNPRAFGRVEFSHEDETWSQTGEADIVSAVDWASNQIQLASWRAASDALPGKVSLRTRWEGPELYEPADEIQPDAPTSLELPSKKRAQQKEAA